jgi:hypothetical protein
VDGRVVTSDVVRCLLRDAQLRSSRWNIVHGRVVFSDVVRETHHVTKHVGVTIHN